MWPDVSGKTDSIQLPKARMNAAQAHVIRYNLTSKGKPTKRKISKDVGKAHLYQYMRVKRDLFWAKQDRGVT